METVPKVCARAGARVCARVWLLAVLLAAPVAATTTRDLLGRLLGHVASPLRVELGAQDERSATLRVSYRGVVDARGARLTARALDRDLRELPGFHVESTALSGTDGDATVTLRYDGTGRVRSAVAEVLLLRAGGGTAATKVVVLPRPWPLGSVEDPTGPDSDPTDPTAPAPETDEGDPADPDAVTLDPLPLGDTPPPAG